MLFLIRENYNRLICEYLPKLLLWKTRQGVCDICEMNSDSSHRRPGGDAFIRGGYQQLHVRPSGVVLHAAICVDYS